MAFVDKAFINKAILREPWLITSNDALAPNGLAATAKSPKGLQTAAVATVLAAVAADRRIHEGATDGRERSEEAHLAGGGGTSDGGWSDHY